MIDLWYQLIIFKLFDLDDGGSLEFDEFSELC